MNRIMQKHKIFQILLAGLIFMGWSASSQATHPTITAEAICDVGSGFVINYTSTSWRPTGGQDSGNPQIYIFVNGVLADSGSYDSSNNYSFSGSVPAPTNAVGGDTVIVSAYAAGIWSDGFPGGQSRSITVTLPDEVCVQQASGRFTGGGNLHVDGVRVTGGLTIHCDLLLSNNLQLNWNGKHFHMTEHLTTIQCSDDPEIDQVPPNAPLDTLIGVGTGRYQNQDGYTIEFTLVDAGEPGTLDEIAIRIYNTSTGKIVLNVPRQHIDGGNLQAHYDQPHK
ncbi:MAG: hypothetical protein H6936_06340 [Burkholderiales bacterium]|nr:hypothetical protein [Nitrosomonas sp.]MCP5274459.1 hypothetical protein [Burkholderiales bacterium]